MLVVSEEICEAICIIWGVHRLAMGSNRWKELSVLWIYAVNMHRRSPMGKS